MEVPPLLCSGYIYPWLGYWIMLILFLVFFFFLGNPMLLFIWDVLIGIAVTSVWELPHQQLVFAVVSSHSNWGETIAYCGLDFPFWWSVLLGIVSCTHGLDYFVSSFETCLFRSFAHFFKIGNLRHCVEFLIFLDISINPFRWTAYKCFLPLSKLSSYCIEYFLFCIETS